ncbi:MAG: hypothetical protein ABI462_04385, partial [Ignavibacteria bacterium]
MIKIIAILFLLNNISVAQSDTSKIYLIDEFRIIGFKETQEGNVIKKEKFNYRDLNSASITQNTFDFRTADGKEVYKLYPYQIKKISIRDGNYMWSGAGYSALAGFGLGFLLGSIGNKGFKSGGTIALGLGAGLGLLFGIFGGLFGAGTPH